MLRVSWSGPGSLPAPRRRGRPRRFCGVVPSRHRVLVVTFDAAEARIMLDLAARGEAPNIATFVEGGFAADVANPDGIYVGATWPTLFTGTSPGRHGRTS